MLNCEFEFYNKMEKFKVQVKLQYGKREFKSRMFLESQTCFFFNFGF